MSYYSDQEIEARAIEVLENSFGSVPKEPPIDLTTVLEVYHLKFRTLPLEDKFKDVDGAYIRDTENPGKGFVFLNESILDTRRMNFTLAHEIGHHILHQDFPAETFFRNTSIYSDDQREVEANKFAAGLIMPRSIVEHYYQYTQDIRSLARLFAVSETAMTYRIKNLGLSAKQLPKFRID